MKDTPLTHNFSSYLESVRDGLELEAIFESSNTMGGRYRADRNDELVIAISEVRV